MRHQNAGTKQLGSNGNCPGRIVLLYRNMKHAVSGACSKPEKASLKLTWHGHSAFPIEAVAAKIVIDPFLSDNPSWDKGWIGYRTCPGECLSLCRTT